MDRWETDLKVIPDPPLQSSSSLLPLDTGTICQGVCQFVISGVAVPDAGSILSLFANARVSIATQDTPWCICSQIACLLYIWLADAVMHPLVDQACVVGLEHLWPLKSARLPADIAKFLYGSGMPALDQKAFDEIGQPADSIGNPAAQECAFLSRRLCASILGQMAVAECPDLDVLNAYTRSSTEVCRPAPSLFLSLFLFLSHYPFLFFCLA